MATIKNISDYYTVNVPLMTINGNLVVTGNTSVIESTNTSIYDNIIVLNSGLSPNVAPTLNAGLTIDRGTQANVTLRWNESTKTWQITNDGSTYGDIATSGTTTANINITGHTIYDSANTVTVYTGAVASGKSGVYVDNVNGTQQELVTKSAAVAYGIIFG
jgi:hypothetical protein